MAPATAISEPGRATPYNSATAASTAASVSRVSAAGSAALASRICCTSAVMAACSAGVAAGMGSCSGGGRRRRRWAVAAPGVRRLGRRMGVTVGAGRRLALAAGADAAPHPPAPSPPGEGEPADYRVGFLSASFPPLPWRRLKVRAARAFPAPLPPEGRGPGGGVNLQATSRPPASLTVSVTDWPTTRARLSASWPTGKL